MKEIWKPIKNFEELYQISNLGNVKSIGRYKYSFKDNKKIYEDKEIMLKTINDRGYMKLHLSKNGKRYLRYIHRLVAEAFIPNPKNYPQVNHIDEDKLNNSIENLEWCTAKYNINYGTARARTIVGLKKYNSSHRNPNSKRVRCVETNKVYQTLVEAGEDIGISYTCISAQLHGKQKTAGGFHWEYAEKGDK